MKTLWLFLLGSLFCLHALAQAEIELLKNLRAKLEKVNDYVAKGRMKVDVSFMNVPTSDVMVYFKKPNKLKVKKEGGISLLPKGGVGLSLVSLLADKNYAVVPAGNATVEGIATKMMKLLPLQEGSDIVLTTLWIDEKELLIRKSNVTTKENGSYEMQLSYGKMKSWGLPDKVVFTFSTKDYKLPKGITFEYEKGGTKKEAPKEAKGKIEITYTTYQVNKGVEDAVFK